MKITINLDLDHEEDRLMWQRIGHVEALCEILWKLKYGDDGIRLDTKGIGKVYRLEMDRGVVIEELWS